VIDHETQSLEVVTLSYRTSSQQPPCSAVGLMNAIFFSEPLSVAMANEQGVNGVGKSGSVGDLKPY
jgi:hypothetical protein